MEFARNPVRYADLWRDPLPQIETCQSTKNLRIAMQHDSTETPQTFQVTFLDGNKSDWRRALPRHKTIMQMPLDYPRINQVPEWFTVDEESRVIVELDAQQRTSTGRELLSGRGVTLDADETKKIRVYMAH